MLLKDFSLGMVSNDARIDEAAQIELLSSKLRHVESASKTTQKTHAMQVDGRVVVEFRSTHAGRRPDGCRLTCASEWSLPSRTELFQDFPFASTLPTLSQFPLSVVSLHLRTLHLFINPTSISL